MADNEQKAESGKGTVSIVGCGWLGLPLAQDLLEYGYKVKGSRRNAKDLHELEQNGIEAYRAVADPSSPFLPERLFRADVLVITLPPGRKDPAGAEAYPGRVRSLLHEARRNGVRSVLFTSSSSVYPETNGFVNEEDPADSEKGNGPLLREVEEAVRKAFPGTSTIVRFGGLIGPGRHPVRTLSGKKSGRSGEAPVNMIHRADAVGILRCIIENGHWGECFNACAPEHPTRASFYERAANTLGISAPEFDPGAALSYKVLDPSKLLQRTGYRFRYPDPMGMPVE